jgi:hypothetical protein
MSERIEYNGNSLPTGLPGFGGGTIAVIELPGINSSSAQNFGPTNDLSNSGAPSPFPPAGSNPENPTDKEVCPATVPPDSTQAGCNCETFFSNGPTIVSLSTGQTFTPQELQVCVGGQPTTWYVLACTQPPCRNNN